MIVKMTDGRSVDFGLRGKLKKSVTIQNGVITLTFDCVNGDVHYMTIDSEHPLFLELAAYGAGQKVSESIAKAHNPEDISSLVIDQINRLDSGEWNVRGERLFRGFNDLLEAVRRVKGYERNSPEFSDLRRILLTKNTEQIKEIKANPRIKSELVLIRSEKAAKKAAELANEPSNDLLI